MENKPEKIDITKQYNRDYYLKNKTALNQRRLTKYYKLKYSPDQLILIQKLRPNLNISPTKSTHHAVDAA